MPVLSIIILNWNTRELLRQCIASIYANPPSCSFEIIVVDNNSDEGIDGVEDEFPNVRLIRNDYNYGFAVGNNIGYRASTGHYVMTLNPDTLILPGSIDRLLQELEEDENVAIAVPMLKEKKAIAKDYTFFNLYFASMIVRHIRSFFERFRASTADPFEVEFFVGTGYVCRRSALAAERFFREDFFLFGEEFWLAREIRAKGLSVRIVPEARIEHFTSVTFKSDKERLAAVTRLSVAVLLRIHREWLGRFWGTITAFLLFAEHVPKLLFLMILGIFKGNSDPNWLRMRAVSRAMVRAIPTLFTNQRNYERKVNAEAELFFNGGNLPSKPTVFSLESELDA